MLFMGRFGFFKGTPGYSETKEFQLMYRESENALRSFLFRDYMAVHAKARIVVEQAVQWLFKVDARLNETSFRVWYVAESKADGKAAMPNAPLDYYLRYKPLENVLGTEVLRIFRMMKNKGNIMGAHHKEGVDATRDTARMAVNDIETTLKYIDGYNQNRLGMVTVSSSQTVKKRNRGFGFSSIPKKYRLGLFAVSAVVVLVLAEGMAGLSKGGAKKTETLSDVSSYVEYPRDVLLDEMKEAASVYTNGNFKAGETIKTGSYLLSRTSLLGESSVYYIEIAPGEKLDLDDDDYMVAADAISGSRDGYGDMMLLVGKDIPAGKGYVVVSGEEANYKISAKPYTIGSDGRPEAPDVVPTYLIGAAEVNLKDGQYIELENCWYSSEPISSEFLVWNNLGWKNEDTAHRLYTSGVWSTRPFDTLEYWPTYPYEEYMCVAENDADSAFQVVSGLIFSYVYEDGYSLVGRTYVDFGGLDVSADTEEDSRGSYYSLMSQNVSILPSHLAEPLGPVDGRYEGNMYKVGVDIPAGQYTIYADGAAPYCRIQNDCRAVNPEVALEELFDGELAVTLTNGQYIVLRECYIKG